ncbi:MAG TPA: ACT domain-containing protein [Acidimicrobiales bacterium]|nr:ACT domain-containing protein [Acidimicrobiales bacterium]
MAHFAVTAVGADRPGIVAAVSNAFVEHGCNIEDSAMTILRGQFAMMLIVAAPQGLAAPALKAALAAPALELGLTVTVEPVSSTEVRQELPAGGASTYTVSVHGADHPGIVHGIADLLARAAVNIIDLTTRVIGGTESPVYVMMLEVSLPPTVDADDLRARLDNVAQELGVTANLHPSEADIL